MRTIKVIFFHRKPRKLNYSVETLFSEIRKNLPNDVEPLVSVAKYESNGFFRRLYICIEAAIRQNRGDINHITGDVNFIGIFFRKNKTVLTLLDVGFMNHSNPIVRCILWFFWLYLPIRRAAVVTTISQATKDEVLKYVNCDPSKIKVIYVPVSEKFKKIPLRLFNKNCPVLLQIGTKYNKNLERLIEAIKDINCHLDIVGELSEYLENKLKRYNINYTLSTRITDEELIYKYSTCDIVSFVSTFEGFGMPIVEANILGKPVITSNISSMPEIAGNAACLVDPFDVTSIRDGMLKLINDDEYRNSLISNGFVNHLRFSPSNISKQLRDIYFNLI